MPTLAAKVNNLSNIQAPGRLVHVGDLAAKPPLWHQPVTAEAVRPKIIEKVFGTDWRGSITPGTHFPKEAAPLHKRECIVCVEACHCQDLKMQPPPESYLWSLDTLSFHCTWHPTCAHEGTRKILNH